MELVENRVRIRCELGACSNFAEYSIKFSRVGIRSRMHICKQCAKELNVLLQGIVDSKQEAEKSLKRQTKAKIEK